MDVAKTVLNFMCGIWKDLNGTAELRLDIEELAVTYTPTESSRAPVKRTFKYSLSRKDLENAIFIGP